MKSFDKNILNCRNNKRLMKRNKTTFFLIMINNLLIYEYIIIICNLYQKDFENEELIFFNI